MRIQLTLDGHPVRATLNDSPAARYFAALLPLSLGLEDFHRTERVADLPRNLDTSGAPDAPTPQAGDLAHYATWPPRKRPRSSTASTPSTCAASGQV
ncbi:cyclophilin-like fold protein [Streptomyces sp. NPDC059153]|uniref:cyclophilin-like fold protein n=1 Tax=unclassified Streptomyces TaxID=2593676 RepID=UPI00368931EC